MKNFILFIQKLLGIEPKKINLKDYSKLALTIALYIVSKNIRVSKRDNDMIVEILKDGSSSLKSIDEKAELICSYFGISYNTYGNYILVSIYNFENGSL